MSIAGINKVSQGHIPVKQSAQDNYENNLRKQITNLQDKMKTISSDEDMSSEQKRKERQKAQEEIQNLNSELRQYQIQKQQEEDAKRKEETRQAMEEADTDTAAQNPAGLSGKEAGVMITLSNTKEQIAGMVRIKKHLESRHRTAATDEEKEKLQKKIDNVSKSIGQHITTTTDTISDYQKTQKYGADKKQIKTQAKNDTYVQKQTPNINIESKPASPNQPNLLNNDPKVFGSASVII